jgi:hypothetical protein
VIVHVAGRRRMPNSHWTRLGGLQARSRVYHAATTVRCCPKVHLTCLAQKSSPRRGLNGDGDHICSDAPSYVSLLPSHAVFARDRQGPGSSGSVRRGRRAENRHRRCSLLHGRTTSCVLSHVVAGSRRNSGIDWSPGGSKGEGGDVLQWSGDESCRRCRRGGGEPCAGSVSSRRRDSSGRARGFLWREVRAERGKEEKDVLASAFDLDAGCLPSGSRSMDGERSILRICLLDGSGWKEDALSPKT